jgi:hypothetical protein
MEWFFRRTQAPTVATSSGIQTVFLMLMTSFSKTAFKGALQE